ncbi:MAG: hypothetical protein ACWGMZ_07675 [Thermoguttaceae bacterium]
MLSGKHHRDTKTAQGFQSKAGLVLFYPGAFLLNQIRFWAERRSGCKYAICFDRALPLIRKRLRRTELAIIDATDDPSQASDAFLQAIGILRSDAVAVYTERTYENLELLVRSLGAPLLLGPMDIDEWEDYLDQKFPAILHLDFPAPAEGQLPHKALDTAEHSQDKKIVLYRPIAG